MSTSRQNPKAQRLIDLCISMLPDFSRRICVKLRQVLHQTDSDIVEDWKWPGRFVKRGSTGGGPHFFKNGLLCGFGAFK